MCESAGPLAAARESRLRLELLLDDALLEIVLGIEQQVQVDAGVLAHPDAGDVAHLGEVGGGADRPLGGLVDLEDHLRALRQHGAEPAPRETHADRQSAVSGKGVTERVDLGGYECIKKMNLHTHTRE